MRAASTFTGLVTAAVLALPAGALAAPDSTGPPTWPVNPQAVSALRAQAPPTWPADPQPLSAPRAESSSIGQPSPDGDGTGTLVVVLIAGGAAAAAGCAGYAVARKPRMRGQRESVAT